MKEEEIKILIQEEVKKIIESGFQVPFHRHIGTDSPQLQGSSLEGAPQSALTTATSGLSSGGAEGLRTADTNILNNMRTRINELESRLQNLGLIS